MTIFAAIRLLADPVPACHTSPHTLLRWKSFSELDPASEAKLSLATYKHHLASTPVFSESAVSE